MLHLPTLHDQSDDSDHMVVPGMSSPVPRASFPAAVASKKSRGYEWYVYHGRRFLQAKGIILNTATDVEPAVLAAMADRTIPLVFPIGPLIGPAVVPSLKARACIEWLDAQPSASVV